MQPSQRFVERADPDALDTVCSDFGPISQATLMVVVPLQGTVVIGTIFALPGRRVIGYGL